MERQYGAPQLPSVQVSKAWAGDETPATILAIPALEQPYYNGKMACLIRKMLPLAEDEEQPGR